MLQCCRLSVILHLYLTIHRVPELTYLSHQILVCCLNTMSAIFHPEIFYWTVFKMKRSTEPFYIYRFMAHRHHDFTGKSSYFMLFIYAFHLCSSVTLTKKEKRTMIEILFFFYLETHTWKYVMSAELKAWNIDLVWTNVKHRKQP